jgi:hypothetical protein
MKYGIYKDSLVDIKDINDNNVYIVDYGDTICVPRKGFTEIPEEMFLDIELEIKLIMDEISNAISRISKLDDAYHQKSIVLRDLLSEARSKEIGLITKVLKYYQIK